jgi:hypothetical protein
MIKCPVCHKYIVPLRLGATIGAAQLKACPECGVVLIDPSTIREIERKS